MVEVYGESLAAQEYIAQKYLQDLGLSWEDLTDKKILDLGAGLGGFAQAAKRRGITIYSIDRNPEWYRDEGKPARNVRYVIGDGLQLPFADESFDLVLSRAAVHSMVETKSDLTMVFSEAKRVLRKGGEFRFGPGAPYAYAIRVEKWDRSLDLFYKLDKEGLSEQEEEELERLLRFIDQQTKLEELEKEAVNGAPYNMRARKIVERAFRVMQSINSDIMMHQGNLLNGPSDDMYFSLRKK